MEYLFNYLLFAAKLITVVAIVALPVTVILLSRHARRAGACSPLEITRLNEVMEDGKSALEAVLLPPKVFKQQRKAAHKAAKQRAREVVDTHTSRTFVCEFSGDLRASAVSELREQITAILSVARADDAVLVVLESGGGTIHGYGLAASQLKRLRDRGIRLTVVVDRIAASGGYMMACVADELVAAPFAIIGSIGVVAQLPNFHRVLKKHDIDFEQITAGEFKRTLTLFGENTDAGRAKFQEEIDDAHTLFKDFVAACRPALDLARVATGEYWFGTRAVELGLVDRLATSDDLIVAAVAAGDVYKLTTTRKRSLLERLTQPLTRWLHSPAA